MRWMISARWGNNILNLHITYTNVILLFLKANVNWNADISYWFVAFYITV